MKQRQRSPLWNDSKSVDELLSSSAPSKKLKSLVRNGIPDDLRCIVWPKILQTFGDKSKYKAYHVIYIHSIRLKWLSSTSQFTATGQSTTRQTAKVSHIWRSTGSRPHGIEWTWTEGMQEHSVYYSVWIPTTGVLSNAPKYHWPFGSSPLCWRRLGSRTCTSQTLVGD